MRFRPCIDLHAGVVKQIVGSTLVDDPTALRTNFEATKSAEEFAEMYRKDELEGGHVIMLGPGCEQAALSALAAYPGGLQVGGGINPENAAKYLEAGASHIIVTSYVFREGRLDVDRLKKIVAAAGGPQRVVLDLSCRRHPSDPTGPYYVVMDKWKTFTDMKVTKVTLEYLSQFCAEFLVHGVDVEGKGCGIEEPLVQCLGLWSPIPMTYAGGCRSLDDLVRVERLSGGRVDVTIGSALDIFGGNLCYSDVVKWDKAQAASAIGDGMAPPPLIVFKVLGQADVAKPGEDFTGSELDLKDGFIHAADAHMVMDLTRRYFAGRSDLCLASLRLDNLPDLQTLRVQACSGAKIASATASDRDSYTAIALPDGFWHVFPPLERRSPPTMPASAVVALEPLLLTRAGSHLFPPYVTGSLESTAGDSEVPEGAGGEPGGDGQRDAKRRKVEATSDA